MRVVLLRVWIKEQIRWISRQLPWQLQLVNELWLLTALLVLAAAYSTYWSFSLLGGWREFIVDPTPLLHIPGFARYLEGYLLIALAFLTGTSFFHFAQFLFPFPEPLFLFTSPVSRWKIYGTRLIYVLLLNLVLLSVVSLPPLIMIGVWAGKGIWLYFALLPGVRQWVHTRIAQVRICSKVWAMGQTTRVQHSFRGAKLRKAPSAM